MIKYFTHKEINKRLWDECITESFNGRIYGYSWYLDSIVESWGALILDDYKAVFPLPFRRKSGIDYIFQPKFIQQLGLFSRVPLSPALLEEFLNCIPSNFKLIDLNLNQHNTLYSSRIYSKKRINIEMDLLGEYDQLRNTYSTNLKRNLKKAAEAKLTVFENLKPEAVVHLFKKNRGAKFKEFTEEEYQSLLRLVYKAIQLGKAEVWGVYTSSNNLCAAAIFLRSHKRVSFLFSSSDSYAREHSALPYLLDSFIEANAGRELVFDFEGAMSESLARFYLGFGSRKIAYTQIEWVRGNVVLRLLLNTYLKWRKYT